MGCDPSVLRPRRREPRTPVYEPDEHTSQAALIEWRDTLVGPFPELGMLLAIPNGGWRAKQVAKRLKAEGVQPGACDLVLLVPMGEHHGLFVEMKTAAGRATAAQRRFIAAARAHGYRAEVCHSWPEAARLICAYLGLPPDAAPER